MIRAGIIGFAHMHVNEIALYISEHPDFELVAAADAKSGVEEIPPYRYTPAWNRDNIRENYCKNIYSDYREMLEKETLEIVFILTENSLKRCVFEDCAKKKINIVVEKPMAVSYKEAVEMGKIAEKYGAENIGPAEAVLGQTSKGGWMTFEQEITQLDDDRAVKLFHACPHAEALAELGESPETIRMFCREMLGHCDYAICEPFPNVDIDFPTTVADGEGQPCAMTITRVK